MPTKKPAKKMTAKAIQAAVGRAIKSGNWMIRIDNDGVSTHEGAKGFRWAPIGEWTEAPDWNHEPVCGGGLHGVNHLASGHHQPGTTVTFCETRGKQVAIERDKIKVRAARRLLINQIPQGVSFRGSLDLRGTGITSLPEGLHVGRSLDLSGTGITSLPEGLHVGGWLDLSGTRITSLPEGLHVGGSLYLSGTGITSLPEGLHVGGLLDLSGTGITSLPEKFKDKIIH